MCTTETTVAQYQAAGMSYQAPGFPQGSDHPAVHVSWNAAKAWCAWLSKREGLNYRLPTDAEWSAAIGGSYYPWGNSWPPPNHFGNYIGQEAKVPAVESYARGHYWFQNGGGSSVAVIRGFRDRHVFTAPVGSYPANWLGIHDLGGNAFEWCEDWYRAGMNDADIKAAFPFLADDQGGRTYRVQRGGSWFLDGRELLRSSCRLYVPLIPMYRFDGLDGFRCVLVLAGG